MPFQIQTLSDINHPELDVYRNISDRELKQSDDLFIAESLEVVTRLLDSELTVHSLLTTPGKLQRLLPVLQRDAQGPEVPVYVVNQQQLAAIAGVNLHRSGIVACAFRPPETDLTDAVRPAQEGSTSRIVVLENVNDPQNIGLVVRNAVAFGADLAVFSGCCDPYYRRAVRVSMGSVFRLPLYFSENLPADLDLLKHKLSFNLIAAVASETAIPIKGVEPTSRTALVFGSERNGLSDSVRRICDHHVVIPLTPGSDSVNIAVAVGIFLYHFGSR